MLSGAYTATDEDPAPTFPVDARLATYGPAEPLQLKSMSTPAGGANAQEKKWTLFIKNGIMRTGYN
jgi:hypothetical protein